MADENKNQWVIWTIIAGAIIVTLIAFNYQGDSGSPIPLSEIFPDEELEEVKKVEFDFAQEEDLTTQETVAMPEVAAEVQRVTAVPRAEKIPKNIKGTYFTIQALSSKNKLSTEKALKKIISKGHASAFIVAQSLEGQGTWYRIYIGQYNSKSLAEKHLPVARKDFHDSFIKHVKSSVN